MVVCCGDALTDQHRVGTGTAVVLDLNRAEYAGFGNLDDVIRQIGGKLLVSAHIDTQILEVTCVDADHTSAGGNGPLDLLARVRLDQNGHLQLMRQIKQMLELIVVERGDDKQHDIRSMSASLPDLIVGDDEILTQYRNAYCSLDLVEIIKRPQKTPTFRQA